MFVEKLLTGWITTSKWWFWLQFQTW